MMPLSGDVYKRQDKAWSFCHKTFLSVLEHTMLHELGNHDADGKEIEEDGDQSPEDDDTTLMSCGRAVEIDELHLQLS